jgi:hypothetical protein
MNEYARARGLALQENTDSEDLAMEIIARRRELVHKHMPELVPEIKAMVEAGLIDGWRNVQRIEVFETGEVA